MSASNRNGYSNIRVATEMERLLPEQEYRGQLLETARRNVIKKREKAEEVYDETDQDKHSVEAVSVEEDIVEVAVSHLIPAPVAVRKDSPDAEYGEEFDDESYSSDYGEESYSEYEGFESETESHNSDKGGKFSAPRTPPIPPMDLSVIEHEKTTPFSPTKSITGRSVGKKTVFSSTSGAMSSGRGERDFDDFRGRGNKTELARYRRKTTQEAAEKDRKEAAARREKLATPKASGKTAISNSSSEKPHALARTGSSSMAARPFNKAQNGNNKGGKR